MPYSIQDTLAHAAHPIVSRFGLTADTGACRCSGVPVSAPLHLKPFVEQSPSIALAFGQARIAQGGATQVQATR